MDDHPSVFPELGRHRGGVARQVRQANVRDRGQRLRAVRLLLERGEAGLPGADLVLLLRGERLQHSGKGFLFPGLPRFAAGRGRLHEDAGGVIAAQQQPAQKRLIIARADRLPQLLEDRAEAQAGCRVAAIEPAGQDLQREHQPARHRAVVALAQAELEARERRFDLLAVEPLLAKVRQGPADGLLDGGQIIAAEVLHLQQEHRLQAFVVAAERHILGQARFQHGAAQRRVVAAAQHVAEDLRGKERLRVLARADDIALPELPAGLGRFSGREGVFDRLARRADGRLRADVGIGEDGCKAGKIAVQQRQTAAQIDLPSSRR